MAAYLQFFSKLNQAAAVLFSLMLNNQRMSLADNQIDDFRKFFDDFRQSFDRILNPFIRINQAVSHQNLLSLKPNPAFIFVWVNFRKIKNTVGNNDYLAFFI